jgi:hypothetical protein
MGATHADYPGAGVEAAADPRGRVLDHHTLGRLNFEPQGGDQKAGRVRLAALKPIGGDEHVRDRKSSRRQPRLRERGRARGDDRQRSSRGEQLDCSR